MVNSAGKMLREARLKKNLLFEEAARATKIRPDRLADLENDDYTRFANMAYAKGFLLIYSKYLGVDISEFTKTMGVGSPVGVADYDYLNNAPATYEPATRRDRTVKKLNYKMLVTVAITVGFMLWATSFVHKLERISPAVKSIEHKENPEVIAAPQASPAPAVADPAPATQPAQPVENLPSAPSLAAIPLPVPEPTIEIRRAEPVVEPAPEPPSPLTPSTTSTDVKNQQSRKSRTH
ncbi:MAG: helix-turn-helix domain-containing protein [Verrucomicrobiota bacterium]